MIRFMSNLNKETASEFKYQWEKAVDYSKSIEDPQPTETATLEDLKEMGMVGMYEYSGEDLEKRKRLLIEKYHWPEV